MARPKKGAVNTMPEATESSPGVYSIWKPCDQEFYLDIEFTDIAAKLERPISEVTFTSDNRSAERDRWTSTHRHNY
jgi:hypothetical protein